MECQLQFSEKNPLEAELMDSAQSGQYSKQMYLFKSEPSFPVYRPKI